MKEPWQTLRNKEFKKSNKNLSAREKIWTALEQILSEHCPAIWQGAHSQTLSQEQLATIEADLKKRLPRQFRQATNLLAAGLTRGIRNQLDWNAPIPDHFHSLSYDTSLFTPPTVETGKEFNRIEELFLASLVRLWKNTEPKQRIAMLLFSAVIYGGLHQKRWFSAWVRALAEPPSIWRDWLWFHLKWKPKDTPVRKQPTKITSWNLERNWVADPVTQLLILNWRHHFPDDFKEIGYHTPDDLLHTALELLGWVAPPGRSRVQALIDVASSRDVDILPGFLTEYQSGYLVSTSLPTSALMRLLTGEVPSKELTSLPFHISRPRKRRRPREEPLTADIDKSVRLIDGLTSFIRTRSESAKKKAGLETDGNDIREKITTAKTLKAINSILRHADTVLTPAAKTLLEWGIKLCQKATSPLELRQGAPLAPSSIATYLSLISQGLLENARLSDLRNLKEIEFEILYEEILTYPLTTDQKIRTAERIKQFHGYLLHELRDIPEVDFEEIMSCYGLPSKRVRANIITFAEYKALLKSFGFERSRRGRWEEIYLVTLILAFRCGLRRGEIQGLQIADIKDRVRAELRIRPGRFRDPKSTSGNRRIPLSTLVPKEELDLVLSWLYKRRGEELDPTAPLLQHPDTGESLIPVNRLFDPIVRILRSITRDTTLTFHSFRHAFATLTLLKLTWPSGLSIRHLPAGLDDVSFSAESRARLATDLLDHEQQGVRSLHALATLLGHAEPSMSFRSYVHLTDWLLGAFKRQSICLPELSNVAWEKLAGLSEQGMFKNKRTNATLSEMFQTQTRSKTRKWGQSWATESFGSKPVPVMQEHTPDDHFWLPPWATLISKLLKEELGTGVIMAPPSGVDAIMARLIFDKLRRLKSRKMIFARRLLPELVDIYSADHSGLVTEKPRIAAELNKLLEILELPGMQPEVHYRQYGSRSAVEIDELVRVWSKALCVPQARVQGKDYGPERGLVVIKLLQTRKDDTGYSLRASTGWRFVLELVSRWLRTHDRTDDGDQSSNSNLD